MKRMSDEAFERLAKAHRCIHVWTTTDSNGYPQNEDLAIIGFDDWEQAKTIAEANGFDAKLLWRRDGWSHWSFRGDADGHLDALVFAKGDWEWYGKSTITPLEKQEKEFIAQWWTVNGDIESAETCDEIARHADLGCEIWRAVANLRDGEIVVVYRETGKYEVMQRFAMRLHDNDVHEYAVALVRPAAIDDDEE